MRVRLLVSRAGTGFSQQPKDIIEVPDNEGARMIEAGQAERVAVQRTETATTAPVESAAIEHAPVKRPRAQTRGKSK